ncbi:4-vinyl reductase [Candidatus Woesearchaeota archaeon]|nr:4-vinyl reductase [Candidatus Woesearchaeota archaeon]
MDRFVYSLIKDGKIKYQGGNFFTFGFPNNIISLPNAAVFFHILKLKYGGSAFNLSKELGKRQIKAMVNLWFPSGTLNQQELELILKYLGIYCYGDIKIASINRSFKEIIFQLKNSPLCRMHAKLFGFGNENSNPFIEGICCGLAEIIFNCKMASEETSCIIKHSNSCYIKSKKDDMAGEEPAFSGCTEDIFSKPFKNRKLPEFSGELIKKVEGHDMMGWDRGMFTIWNTGAFTFPSISMAFLIREFQEKFDNGVNSILYHLGRVQSREAVLFQVEKYGFKKDNSLFQSVLEQMGLTGFGIGALEKVEFKNKTACFKSLYNPTPFYYRELFGKTDYPLDNYVSGLISGMCEAFFEEPMESEETKCIARGDEYCLYEVKRQKSDICRGLEKRYLSLIEEKVTANNFVI